MKIFNTQTQKKETINLKKPIGIYVCGITPYDTTHLGHAFTFTIYDTLIRYLRFLGAKVTYVQNVTDIDDDILIKAKSLGVNWQDLGKLETQKYLKNMDSLNALRPDYYPRATKHIEDMIKIIKTLLQKKIAYVKNGSIYFHIKRDKNFGKLSKLDYPAMLQLANERGNFPQDPSKIDPLDFVLWQRAKPGEPSWSSPWGKGRPGWHIECSAMSLKYLGPTITIHGGGEDLIFPHHECEIAQSQSYTGKKFVEVWAHTAMIYCQDKKMSKSLGNMIFISDLLSKYSPNAVRIFLLMHKWRNSWNFKKEEFKKAQNIAGVLENIAGEYNNLNKSQLKKSIPKFFKFMDDDLNTPMAIAALLDFSKGQNANKPEVVFKCGQILGLNFS